MDAFISSASQTPVGVDPDGFPPNHLGVEGRAMERKQRYCVAAHEVIQSPSGTERHLAAPTWLPLEGPGHPKPGVKVHQRKDQQMGGTVARSSRVQ